MTYLPLDGDNFILTFNRDEHIERPKAFLPELRKEEGLYLLYPLDSLAGGTWFGVSSLKRSVCLLNGAFGCRQKKRTYKKSRGLVVKEVLKALDITSYIHAADFWDTAPFTMIVIDWNKRLKITELIWDEITKQVSCPTHSPRIWSSSTLYTVAMHHMRKKWFSDWLSQNRKFTQEGILNFHHKAGIGDRNIDLLVDRKHIKTLSIASLKKEDTSVKMYYKDIERRKETSVIFDKIHHAQNV